MRFVSLANFWFAYPVTVAVRPGVTLRKDNDCQATCGNGISKTASFVTMARSIQMLGVWMGNIDCSRTGLRWYYPV